MPKYKKRLTPEQRLEIVELRKKNKPAETVAARYNTTVHNVYAIVSQFNATGTVMGMSVGKAKAVLTNTSTREQMIRDYKEWKKNV